MKDKKWLWLFILALVFRIAYRYHRQVERDKEAEGMRQAQVVKQFTNESQLTPSKEVTTGLARIVNEMYLNDYKLEREGAGYSLKDSSGTIVLDKIEAYENTLTPLFIFAREDGVYAVNTETNAKYGPYLSASTVQLLKDQQLLKEKGLAFREDDKIYILRQEALTEVRGTEGNFETGKDLIYNIDTGILGGE